MQENQELAGVLYIDGHEKVYFGKLNYEAELSQVKQSDEKWEEHTKEKAELPEQINIEETRLAELKFQRKNIEREIPFSDLPENYKFESVFNERKQYVDTIKFIAYRSETSLANSISKYMSNPKSASTLIVQFFKSIADLDVQKQKLIVRIHNQPRFVDNEILKKLCDILNETETIFPQTDLKMVYCLNESKDTQKDHSNFLRGHLFSL
jgi:hypothetical protein